MAEEINELKVDDGSPLLHRDGMFHKLFPSDYRQVRYFALLLVQKAPPEIKEINLLEQQICELLRNAIKHGNKNDPSKSVNVWFEFDTDSARLIIQDEGEGFKDLEHWNEFNRKRIECLQNENFEELAEYVSYRTNKSDDEDGGNAMFAALEYWNGGIVYSSQRNTVAVLKRFPTKRYGVRLEEIEADTLHSRN
ncbi:MAG: ATP-binding protein [Spirochaetales bacterium]